MNIEDLKTEIPLYVFDVGRILEKEGFKTYLVGGSVRDILMKREPKDYDIGTNALPSQILGIFPKAISTGAKFGSIIVLLKDKEGETHSIDVTTFRVEEEYIGGRWPSKVEFTDDLMIDLSRRDFTINAIAIDIGKLVDDDKNEIIYDPYKGRNDIQRKLVRAVGDPFERMKEDALRALRACRFASVLGFKLDKGVVKAVKAVLNMIDNLSSERVRDEILKIIYDSNKPSVGLNLLRDLGILKIWIPELLEGIGVDQPEYHAFDVYNHLVKCVDAAPHEVKLAALFHDIGKPRKKAGKHFYGHDVLGASMTREIMKRLRFSNKEIERVVRLVRWHMFYFPYDEEDFQSKKSLKVL
jgi:tRNA nucleotidyltransferase (CCA-adding enzyme)